MKKKLLTSIIAFTCIFSLAACSGKTESISKENGTSTSVSASAESKSSTSVSTASSASVSEPQASVSEDNNTADYNINGIWVRDKLNDEWIVIENEGTDWKLYSWMGDVAVKGTVKLSGDNFDLVDEFGDTYATVNLMDANTLFDVDYQSTYSKTDSLPEVFPGVLAHQIGFGAIEGNWIYQTSTRDNTSEYTNMAYVEVFTDGTYSIRWLDDMTEATGMIMIDTYETPDGAQNVVYSFIEGGNNPWVTAEVSSENPEVLVIGQEGTERMIINIGEGD